MGHKSEDSSAIDLSISLGSLELKNPVMPASGTFGYGHEVSSLTEGSAMGALVTKTITALPRAGNPSPRLQETPAGLLNSIGLQNVGAEEFKRTILPELITVGPPLIVSIGGHTREDFARCVEMIDGDDVDAFELNISCPNVASGMEFSRSPQEAAKVISGVRRVTSKAIFAKLSPNVTDIVSVGRACLESGSDGLTAVNTFLGMAVDVDTEAPHFQRVVGGLSGPAIRPLALARVWELTQKLTCPVIGVGGIVTASDAMQFLLAGASAVQVGTANFRDPAKGAHLVSGLREILARKGAKTIREKIGGLRLP